MRRYLIHHRTLIASFKHAFEGIVHTFKYNQNFRIQIAGAILVILASIFFHVNAFEMGILGVMILLVICAEMINTALEEMVDLITTTHQKEAKIAKDVAAGMVLITFMGSIIVGSLIFIPYIAKFFNGH
ncbi:MAG: diacylglycerol kinase family protein [Candidatus Levybacteria bacterium]|nr:diacylglycerol kinase family protein [Candidatus Levybacteria bacterium]